MQYKLCKFNLKPLKIVKFWSNSYCFLILHPFLQYFHVNAFNPRSLEEKILTRSLEGGWGQSDPPPTSTFDTNHPIDMKFGAYNRASFVLSINRNHIW